jgi:hypothetical protein
MLLIFVVLYVPTRSDAQQRAYRKYLTQQVMERLKTENPDYAANLATMEDNIQSYTGDASEHRTLPLVFHVLHGEEQTFPDEAQILKQVKKLNEIFGTYTAPTFESYPNADVEAFYALGVDCNISFCVPQDVPGHNGINFYTTAQQTWAADDKMKKTSTGGADVIDNQHFINVWVVDLAEANAAGYAQLPGGTITTDGIVIDKDYLLSDSTGLISPYMQGKTLAHLVASYLGVYELWNDYDYCKDDFVKETPIHNAPNFSISIESNHRHITMCPNDLIEMYMNFMDNTDDNQLSLFTEGQIKRMKAILSSNGQRGSLANETMACMALGQKQILFVGKVQKTSNTVLLYPNPTSGNVQIRLSVAQSGEVTISVINALGMQVHAQSYLVIEGNQDILLDCERFPMGTYFVRVQFADKSIITKNLYIHN